METVTIKRERYEVIHKFPVLHIGWEMDNIGYVVRTSEGNKLVMSSHGSENFAEVSDIIEKIEEYRNAVALSEEALQLITPPKPKP